MARSALDVVDQILRIGLQDLGAMSATLYLRDPWWKSEYRLVVMRGVKYPEPMHGFIMPDSSRKVLLEGGARSWVKYAASSHRFREQQTEVLKSNARRNSLFGDFVRREGVKSTARLQIAGKEHVRAVLFVNFETITEFTDSLKKQILLICDRIEQKLPLLEQGLRRSGALPFRNLMHILQAQGPLAEVEREKGVPKKYLRRLLKAAFEAFSLDPDEDLGTVHVLDPGGEVLHLAAWYGPRAPAIQEQSVVRGEGVLSWVALRKRALLIEDVAKSAFGDEEFFVELLEGAMSEIAVPMLAGDQLVGVFNLEAARRGRFRPQKVRILSYAANQAALACAMGEDARAKSLLTGQAESLLGVCHQALASSGAGVKEGLDELASVMRDMLLAKRCDFWQWDRRERSFEPRGCSDWELLEKDASARPDGWSNYLLETGTPVWLQRIKKNGKASRWFWDADRERWFNPRRKKGEPSRVNRALTKNVRHALGLPIEVDDRRVGVVWAKYEDETSAPDDLAIEKVKKFADYAGMVLDFADLEREARAKAEVEIYMKIRRLHDRLFPKTVKIPDALAMGVCSVPYSGPIGGDFYTVIPGSRGTKVRGLIGDGEAKGMLGALNMLPILTTYRIFSRETNSTKYLLERFIDVAEGFESTLGSALCFIIDFSSSPAVLCASAAGHPGLMVVRAGLKAHFEVPDTREDETGRGPILGIPWARVLTEPWVTLESGDTIVGYTDGVSEAANTEGEEFGMEGILGAFIQMRDASPEALADGIVESAREFAGGRLQDDATVLVMKFQG